MIVLDEVAMLDLLAQGRAVAQQLPEEAALHLQRAAGHDVVERRHALEQRDVLKGAGDALLAATYGRMRARVSPLKVMRPSCGW